MGKLVEGLLEGENGQEILEEWTRHIEKKANPAVFANFYLEIMRDPENDDRRRDAAALITYLRTRDWDEIRKEVDKLLDKRVRRVFASLYAEEFYSTWKAMVVAQIEDYWDQFMKTKKRKDA